MEVCEIDLKAHCNLLIIVIIFFITGYSNLVSGPEYRVFVIKALNRAL